MTKDEALRLALEALEKISRTQYHIETPPIESLEERMRRIADQAITASKAALVAKVEPVAWVHETGFLAFNPAVSRYAGMKLYATPQRTWVGLTDEEIMDLWKQVYEPGHQLHVLAKFLAREVEAKLKEKNS